MALKYRFYNHEKQVKLSVAGKTVTLKSGDLFKVDVIEGHVAVVKDGYRYPVNPKYVKELQRRSTVAKPSDEFKAREKAFDVLGHSALKYVEHMAKKLAKTEVVSAFQNGYAYAKFVARSPEGEVVCCLSFRHDVLLASVYHAKTQDVQNWEFVPVLNQAIRKIAARLREKHGVNIGKFVSRSAVLGNVQTPWREPFSGRISYYAARWEL